MKLPLIKINFVAVYKFLRKYILSKKQAKYNFGLIPDKKDNRDIIYKLRRAAPLPATTNKVNINAFTFRYDQGNIGSCVGNGVVEAFRRVLQVNSQPDYNLSRLFAYWISREDKLNDTGAMIRDAFKAMNRFGICSELTWPYVTSKFADTPPSEAFDEALSHQTIKYERLPHTKEAIMDAVHSGFPVVYGKAIYDSFMSSRSGIIPMPKRCIEEYLGGHCMVIFDYNEKGTIELNSWGANWGDKGTCEVPWKYVLDKDLCQDFWALSLTE